jgi:hypothetical protein
MNKCNYRNSSLPSKILFLLIQEFSEISGDFVHRQNFVYIGKLIIQLKGISWKILGYIAVKKSNLKIILSTIADIYSGNLVPRAFPFLSLGRREKALAPGGLLCILIGQ